MSTFASSGRGHCRCGRIAVGMVDNDGSSPTSRRRHVVRLAVFAGFLPGMFYLVAVTRVVDVEEVPRAISATGPAAPLAYVVVSAVLGALLVPGAILAAGSGLLFGPVLGIFVTLGAAVGIAIVASRVGGRAGRDSARAAGYETRRPHRRADRTTRTLGGRRAALHPRHIGCARLFAFGRSEFRCGRWPSVRLSVRRRGHSSTRRWAPRSGICRRRWHTGR
jgi:predicted secreted protein